MTRPETGKKTVTLTATITFDNKVLTRDFEAVVKGEDYYDMVLDISDEKGVDIQDNMYGLFFEDINYAADGGLYAEMVENRSFEQVSTTTRDGKATAPNPGYAWSALSGSMEYKTESPLNDNNLTYLEFTGTVSAKAQKDGTQAFGGVIAENVTGEWKKYEAVLTAENTVRYSEEGGNPYRGAGKMLRDTYVFRILRFR